MPKRIQRKRTKGWRMPPGAVYVGRPTKWGNPFVTHPVDRIGAYKMYIQAMIGMNPRKWNLDELRGKDLACWCPLSDEGEEPYPCHADILLELANEA